MEKVLQKWNTIVKQKWFHITLIILGSIFILLGAFHTEVWYDEAYTMYLVRHDYADIIRIDSGDVHPVLYYLLLKTFTMPFNNSILACRLFSAIPAILLGILGYTHIRKDFGEKVGVAYTFLMFFLPFVAMYAMEIRMYTWTMLFVTLTGIYAYRIVKKYRIKNWILFAIFSLLAAHCHYYGLATVALINGLLFFYILFSKKMYEENQASKKKYIITFFIMAVIQVLGYLPWVFVFLKQAQAVSKGYWIPLNLAETVAAPLGIQFNGRLNIPISVVFTLIMYAYLIFQIVQLKKQKKNLGVVWFCLLAHFGIYFAMLLITVLIKPIMYHRYMLIPTGILMFAFAYCLANNDTKKQKIFSFVVVMIILGLSIYNNSMIVIEDYDPSNGEEIRFLQENYQEGDMILYQDIYQGPNVMVHFPEYNQYLYHIDPNHDVKPFENFSPPTKIIFDEETLKNYTGRIILIDNAQLQFYNEIIKKYDVKEIERKTTRPRYRSLTYQFVIVEKNS